MASASAPERILQRLDWQVVRRLDGMLQGDYRSLFLGHGVDLAGLREYQPEDDEANQTQDVGNMHIAVDTRHSFLLAQ